MLLHWLSAFEEEKEEQLWWDCNEYSDPVQSEEGYLMKLDERRKGTRKQQQQQHPAIDAGLGRQLLANLQGKRGLGTGYQSGRSVYR